MIYKSCTLIRDGFNFYRSGKITACCTRVDPELELAHIDDPDLPAKILAAQTRLRMRHKLGDAPAVCRTCPSFGAYDWDSYPARGAFTQISLNHFKKCNLKCVHCGYRRQDDSEHDTPHEKVFAAIKNCIAAGILVPKPYLEVGGGEPSLARGIKDIMQHALENGWQGLINSNGAKFSQVFANGVNAGLFALLLTPDAGSRETYARIKGVDNFDNAWRNIGRYMAATAGKAIVKFILEEGNKHDIPAMVETAKTLGVQTLMLSMDMNLPTRCNPEYIAKAKEFYQLAGKNGLSVLHGAFLPEF
ncbi:MAG: hypothetical protein K2G99_08175 [Desulfovibrio sp.]|nr:hypothetical protein [Desulfovibrio sp.]